MTPVQCESDVTPKRDASENFSDRYKGLKPQVNEVNTNTQQ